MATSDRIDDEILGDVTWSIASDHIQRIECLGFGNNGEVYLGRHPEYGFVTVKTLQGNNSLSETELESTEEGIDSLVSMTTCKHLLKIHRVITEIDSMDQSLVTEYLGHGSIRQVQRRLSNQIPLPLKVRIIYDVVEGMAFLHTQDMIHGNLKSDNVLIDDSFHAKISDYGMLSLRSNFDFLISPDNNNRRTLSSRNVCIVPPEYLACPNKSPEKSYDVYSFGIVMWELLSGKEHCANTQTSEEFITMVRDGYRPDIKDLPENCPKSLLAILQECWDESPENRPTFEDLHERIQLEYQHFDEGQIHEAVTEVQQILKSNPTKDRNRTHGNDHCMCEEGIAENLETELNCDSNVNKQIQSQSQHQKSLLLRDDPSGGEKSRSTDERSQSYAHTDLQDGGTFEGVTTKAPPMSKTLSQADLYQVLEGLLALEETDDIDAKPTRRRCQSLGTYLSSPSMDLGIENTSMDDLTDDAISPKDSSTVTFQDEVKAPKEKKTLRKFLSFDENKGQRSKQKRASKRRPFWNNNSTLPRTHSEYNFEGRSGTIGRPLSTASSGENIRFNSITSASMPNLASSTVYSYQPQLISKITCVTASLLEVRNPRGVAVSSTGMFYLCESGTRRLQSMTTKNPSEWKYPPDNPSSRPSKKPQFDPRDVTLTHDEMSILVSDFHSDSVLEISLSSNTVTNRYKSDQMKGPWGLKPKDEGSMYVVCNKSHCILELQKGEVVKQIGKFGSGPGEFKGPTYLTIDSRENLIVADCKNFRIQVLTSEGAFIQSIRDKQKLPCISGIVVDKFCNIYVADEKLGYVWVYDEDGSLKTRIKRCEGDKKFMKPQGMALTHEGDVVVADKSCVRVFNSFQF